MKQSEIKKHKLRLSNWVALTDKKYQFHVMCHTEIPIFARNIINFSRIQGGKIKEEHDGEGYFKEG